MELGKDLDLSPVSGKTWEAIGQNVRLSLSKQNSPVLQALPPDISSWSTVLMYQLLRLRLKHVACKPSLHFTSLQFTLFFFYFSEYNA